MNYTITKTKVECYKLRDKERGMGWADITIDANDKTGRIQIASDYGDWQYYWGSCGCPFKEFLCGLNIDYVASKFNSDVWFDAYETIKQFRKDVADNKPSKAKEINKEITTIENNYYNKEEFIIGLRDADNLMFFYGGTPELVYTLSPQFKEFWNNVWPAFTEELKKEIEANKKEAALYDI